jgi:hypothetical protein
MRAGAMQQGAWGVRVMQATSRTGLLAVPRDCGFAESRDMSLLDADAARSEEGDGCLGALCLLGPWRVTATGQAYVPHSWCVGRCKEEDDPPKPHLNPRPEM